MQLLQIIISCVFFNGSFKSFLVLVSLDYRIHDVFDFLVNEESLSPTLPNHKQREGSIVENRYNFSLSKSKQGNKQKNTDPDKSKLVNKSLCANPATKCGPDRSFGFEVDFCFSNTSILYCPLSFTAYVSLFCQGIPFLNCVVSSMAIARKGGRVSRLAGMV